MSILNDADILAVAVGVDLNDTTGILLSVETNMEWNHEKYFPQIVKLWSDKSNGNEIWK